MNAIARLDNASRVKQRRNRTLEQPKLNLWISEGDYDFVAAAHITHLFPFPLPLVRENAWLEWHLFFVCP